MKRTLFRVETCREIKVEKIKSAQFIGGYFCNIFNYINGNTIFFIVENIDVSLLAQCGQILK